MKRPSLFLVAALFCASFATSCMTAPDPENLENTIIAQDEKMRKKVEKARARDEKWDRKWENYSRRQDEKYDAWLDGIF